MLMKDSTKKRPTEGEGGSVNATFSLDRASCERLEHLVGRHCTLEGRAAISKSELVRDLIERAYRAKRR